MRMYYYTKPCYEHPVLKSSQEYGKEARQAGVVEGEREWRYLAPNGRIKIVKSRSEVKGLMLMEEINEKPASHDEGKYCVAIFDGYLQVLPGRYKSKSAAARLLPGLSLIYDYVCVLGDDVQPFTPRMGVNADIYDD